MSKLKPKLFSVIKGYTKQNLIDDVTAGIIVAIIALPLSIALGIASGVTPEKGLITAIIAGFLISFFGGSRVQIGGPTGAFMVIVYGIVVEHGVDGLIIATIMAGIILIIFGLINIGSVIKFIPYPITTGFTAGIAVTIFSSQVNDFLGLNVEALPVEFLEKWHIYFENMYRIDRMTVGIGVIALIIIVLWPKVTKKIPGALIAIIVTATLVQMFSLDVSTIGSKFGEISGKLPTVQVPRFSLELMRVLIAPAFTIAILGAIESLLSAVVSDAMIGSKHRSNMELIAQGIANIGSGLFGGIPATGAIARTVANIKNGGRTPIAGIVHSITLLLIMLLFMPLAKLIPLSTLAAILMVVAYNMSEWRDFIGLFKAPKSDILVLVITFTITVVFDLVLAIQIGIVLAAFLFMKRMADVTNVSVNQLDASEENEEEYNKMGHGVLEQSDQKMGHVQIYDINGPFFFGAVDKFLDTLRHINADIDLLIIRMYNVPAMDATALHALKRLVRLCEQMEIKMVIEGVNEQPKKLIEKAGFSKYLKKEVLDVH
jgi:SulP family sulfate permease